MSDVAPIRPQDLAQHKQRQIPAGVIEAFNEMIAKNFSGSCSVIRQDDIVAVIVAKLGCERSQVFDDHWLDVEPIFQAAGWDVLYDKDYRTAATFTFTPKG